MTTSVTTKLLSCILLSSIVHFTPCHSFITTTPPSRLSTLLSKKLPPPPPLSQHSNNILPKQPPPPFTTTTSLPSLPPTQSYHLTRSLFLRGLGFVHVTSFLVALFQNKALVGDDGITPARRILNDVDSRARNKRERRREWRDEMTREVISKRNFWNGLATRVRTSRFWDPFHYFWDGCDSSQRPLVSLFRLIPPTAPLDPWLDAAATTGLLLSLVLLLFGTCNVCLLVTLWLLQRSLHAIGGPWYGYGWEPQLAELTFHSLFLVPLLSFDASTLPPPFPIVYLVRWHLFRVMMGAGLIKLRSNDVKWKFENLTAMDYFYETQPCPNPFSKFWHERPKWWHRFEVLTNHVVELVLPWGLILPWFRGVRVGCGLMQLVFQMVLIGGGNLSFLNWLTMLPAIFCLDDAILSRLPFLSLPSSFSTTTTTTHPLRHLTTLLATTLLSILTIPVIRNLLSPRQKMNASFDPLRLVSSYGAFGVVEEERVELIIESAASIAGPWKPYEFKAKPGAVERRPRWISPYHYRLDWQLWIAACVGGVERSGSWMYSFLAKVLEGDGGVRGLLAVDPWEGEEEKPRYIRVEKYKYRFSKIGEDGYWVREKVGRYFPRQGVASIETLREMVSKSGD